VTEHLLGSEAGGTTLAVRLGDRIIVRLPETPTTGYRWAVDDSGGAVTVDSTTFEPPTDPTLPGSGGARLVTATATAAGTGSLRLTSVRRGGSSASGDSWEVRIEVQT
jgi:inhibitor of cysteine peptidase